MAIVGAWLAMDEFNSEEAAAYQRYTSTITRVYPSNGGHWDAEGNLLQLDHRLNWEWPLALPGLARQNGQEYAPAVGTYVPHELMDNPAVWELALDNMLELAFNRFDSPWHGVIFDIEGLNVDYREKQNAFYTLASENLHGAGLEMHCWLWNCLEPHEHVMCDHATDWATLAPLFDYLNVGEAYYADYTPPEELCIAPIW